MKTPLLDGSKQSALLCDQLSCADQLPPSPGKRMPAACSLDPWRTATSCITHALSVIARPTFILTLRLAAQLAQLNPACHHRQQPAPTG
jgi:hypothetical protein